MTTQCGTIFADQPGGDLFSDSQAVERCLNAAIIAADISRGFEEYIQIFEDYYDQEIEVSLEAGGAVHGKELVRAQLMSFIVPLHVIAEMGRISISLQATPISVDVAGETHSTWSAELEGISGRTVKLSWRTARKWKGSRVIAEHHYDYEQSGEALTLADLAYKGFLPTA
jgi:hypothetical protein